MFEERRIRNPERKEKLTGKGRNIREGKTKELERREGVVGKGKEKKKRE